MTFMKKCGFVKLENKIFCVEEYNVFFTEPNIYSKTILEDFITGFLGKESSILNFLIRF